MAGRIIDLAHATGDIQGPVVLDSNVVIARWLASFESPHTRNAERAGSVYEQLHASGAQTALTPTGYNEVLHAAIRALYRESREIHRGALVAHFGRSGGFTWRDLYKINPSLLHQQPRFLEELRSHLVGAGIVILDPRDFDASSSLRRIDQQLPDFVVRYGLDSSDAMMLLEAEGVGIHGIVSFDPDMRRAATDFDVYTWLDRD